ncbi:MAG: bifunctional adenosylcobinamide kinase/adenosylcobinamide-phosphate guanylyltransferase [Paracoccaceae bacterium]|nr:bifunctional adenosylcobinamide kinase/adenosylcobinamide-phosphate guanylyltransferase [Paracoccaceae bacterium]
MTIALPHLTLVLGGAASGKSLYAERLAVASGLKRVYVATARPSDAEMRQKIDRHRSRRGTQWTTIEAAGTDLVDLLTSGPGRGARSVVLVDSLTLWTSELVVSVQDVEKYDARASALREAVRHHAGPVICVSDDVSGGIVPANPLTRHFRDCHGRLNQGFAEDSDLVVLVTAGLPLALKGQLLVPETR